MEITYRDPIIRQLVDKASEMKDSGHDESNIRETLINDLINNDWDHQRARSYVSDALRKIDLRNRSRRSDAGKPRGQIEINGAILDRTSFKNELYSRFKVVSIKHKDELRKFLLNLSRDIEKELGEH